MNIFQNFDKLVDTLFEPVQTQNNLFINSCFIGDIQVIKILLDFVDPSIYNNRAINQACLKGHFDVVELLLEDSRVDPSANNNIAFQTAYKVGNIDIIDLLLRKIQVDSVVLELATHDNKFDVVNRILQDTTLQSEQLTAVLHIACINNNIDIIDRLLQDPRLDKYMLIRNQHLLYWINTSMNKNIDFLHILLQDSRIGTIDIQNLFAFSCQAGNETIMLYLLHVYPLFDPGDFLIQASQNGMVQIVDKLLQDETGRVDPSLCEHYAFRISCEIGCVANVRRFLQDKRTDPSAHNNYAIKHARKNGFYEIVELIRKDSRFKQ